MEGWGMHFWNSVIDMEPDDIITFVDGSLDDEDDEFVLFYDELDRFTVVDIDENVSALVQRAKEWIVELSKTINDGIEDSSCHININKLSNSLFEITTLEGVNKVLSNKKLGFGIFYICRKGYTIDKEIW